MDIEKKKIKMKPIEAIDHFKGEEKLCFSCHGEVYFVAHINFTDVVIDIFTVVLCNIANEEKTFCT